VTLEEYDDKDQNNEMVYGVTKDDVNKRITLVFRGSENALSLRTNWSANLYFNKEKANVPDAVKDVIPGGMRIHGGYYNYMFKLTEDKTDKSEFRKYDEILEDVKSLLKKNPTYKLYVTGHSLGAALANLMAFYLVCDPEIPKPVTCINFASPRLGDANFLAATQWLEERNWLRMLRVV
jgi:hypothetical protein